MKIAIAIENDTVRCNFAVFYNIFRAILTFSFAFTYQI